MEVRQKLHVHNLSRTTTLIGLCRFIRYAKKKCYEINRKSRKCVFSGIFLDVSNVNAHAIFKERCPETTNLSNKQFRLAIIASLVSCPKITQRGQRERDQVINNFKPYVPPEKKDTMKLRICQHKRYIQKVCTVCNTKAYQHRMEGCTV